MHSVLMLTDMALSVYGSLYQTEYFTKLKKQAHGQMSTATCSLPR